jgi:16S rRNA (guanine1207-N2)-methyltransferase
MRRPHTSTPNGDAATSVVIGALDVVNIGTRPLIVDEPSGQLHKALAGRGSAPHTWLRHAIGGQTASAWPPVHPFSSAFVRLPKSKDALDFALHAAASVVPADGSIVLFGANDEGIRSVGPHLEGVADGVIAVDTRRHCRVLAGMRRAQIAGLRAALENWRHEDEIALLGQPRRWLSYPGVFAGGKVDDGTALLLANLPALKSGARVLDYGCGTGVISAAVLQTGQGAIVDLVDADALAVEAARENVADGQAFAVGDRLSAIAGAYDAILSNPPLHAGVAENHEALERLIAESPSRLNRHGILQIVVQRRVKAGELMQAAFGNVTVVAEDARYRVLRSEQR